MTGGCCLLYLSSQLEGTVSHLGAEQILQLAENVITLITDVEDQRRQIFTPSVQECGNIISKSVDGDV